VCAPSFVASDRELTPELRDRYLITRARIDSESWGRPTQMTIDGEQIPIDELPSLAQVRFRFDRPRHEHKRPPELFSFNRLLFRSVPTWSAEDIARLLLLLDPSLLHAESFRWLYADKQTTAAVRIAEMTGAQWPPNRCEP
jgi:hypothetical protein